MKNYLRIAIICAAVAMLSAGVGAYAATNLGSESDPLVALSYLDQVLEPELSESYEQQTHEKLAALEARLASEDESIFRAVTLAAGKTLTCDAGCEILVRAGDGYVTGAMLDVTAGESMAKNAGLSAHHLYLAVEDNAAVTAVADTTLMVRGGYTIN